MRDVHAGAAHARPGDGAVSAYTRKCRTCHGRGKLGGKPCPSCKGKRFVIVERDYAGAAPKYGPEPATQRVPLRVPPSLYSDLTSVLAEGQSINAAIIAAMQAYVLARGGTLTHNQEQDQ